MDFNSSLLQIPVTKGPWDISLARTTQPICDSTDIFSIVDTTVLYIFLIYH